MALPNTNISVAMVKSELGASTNDVGQLCIHPNINMWSGRKPVQFPSVNALVDAEFTGKYHNSGILFAEMESHNGFGYYEILYQKPTGGLESPYRLSDFSGYNKNALPPMYLQNVPNATNKFLNQTIISNLGNTDNAEISLDDVQFTPNSPITNPDDSLVQYISELFVGCEVRSSGTLAKEVFSEKSISETETFRLPIYNLAVGEYELAFFLFAPNATDRRFPFPHNLTYPNHMFVTITESTPFNMTAVRYSAIDTDSRSTILNVSGVNSVPLLAKMSHRALYTATEDVTLRKGNFILNVTSDIFNNAFSNELIVVAKSDNVVETATEITIPAGSYATMLVVRAIQYNDSGETYIDPYPVNLQLKYGELEIDNQSFTLQKIII